MLTMLIACIMLPAITIIVIVVAAALLLWQKTELETMKKEARYE